MKDKDEDLVRCWQQQKDHTAAGALYDRYEQKLLFYIYSKVGNYHDSKEILDETFMRVTTYINSFHHKGTFQSWLYTIANNVIKKFYQQRKLVPQTMEDIGEFIVDPLDSLPDKEQNERLSTCLQHLLPRNRAIVLQRFCENFTLAEISQAFSLSPEGVRKIVKLSLEKLRICIQNSGETDNG